MGLFWRRKKDEFVSLRLNEPAIQEEAPSPAPAKTEATPAKPETATAKVEPVAPPVRPAEPPKPLPEPPAKEVSPPPVPSRSPFATSVLGLDRSIEELQAQE